MIQSNRNCSLDIFRYVCALLVVAIHVHPLMDINYSTGYFATQVIPRIAVPFFFAVSGYYFINSLYNNNSMSKILKKFFIIYMIWSIIYLSATFFDLIIKSMPLTIITKKIMLKFFITGSFYHLWFFPALFFAMISVFISYKLKLMKILFIFSVIFYCIGCLGCSWYVFGNKILFISHIVNLPYFNLIRRILFMGLPFFMIGYLLFFLKIKYRDVSNKKFMIVLIIFDLPPESSAI